MDKEIDELQKLNLFQRSRFLQYFIFEYLLTFILGCHLLNMETFLPSVKSDEIRVQTND